MTKTAILSSRAEPHTIVIAKGSQIRHFTLRPWIAALAGAMALAMVFGYLAATGYLILRDDVLKAALMRQAHVQHAYEDRIAALRTQVDRITSHQLLDQQFIETKIAQLANRQSVLAQRSGALLPLIERARQEGVGAAPALPAELPVPMPRPDNAVPSLNKASLVPQFGPRRDPVTTGAIAGQAKIDPAQSGLARLGEVGATLDQMENQQLAELSALTRATYARRNAIIEAAASSGLPIASEPVEIAAVGGPFVPFDEALTDEEFSTGLSTLQQALNALDETRDEIAALPVAHPAPGQKVSSGFGKRRDPILGRSAFHAGIDFRAPTGTPIRAPADGTVAKAGRSGGYGKMVELRHGNGLTTRFAHLSSIAVKRGQKVQLGALIGKSGNTGRSTGPHLHYEIRVNGEAVNPKRYLQAGSKLDPYL